MGSEEGAIVRVDEAPVALEVDSQPEHDLTFRGELVNVQDVGERLADVRKHEATAQQEIERLRAEGAAKVADATHAVPARQETWRGVLVYARSATCLLAGGCFAWLGHLAGMTGGEVGAVMGAAFAAAAVEPTVRAIKEKKP